MIRRILVGVAGTPATEAKIAYTVELAARHDASISAMSVVDVVRLAKVGPVPLGGAHCAKARITRSRDGIPAGADRVGADLLVLGTHYRKAMIGKRFGSTVLGTLKTSDRPVFMTH